MNLRKTVHDTGCSIAAKTRRAIYRILGETKKHDALEGVIDRALTSQVNEKKRLPSEDRTVYGFINTVYGADRPTVRELYRAYQAGRDEELERFQVKF